MLAKTLKFVPQSLSTDLFLSNLTFVGPYICFPGYCSDIHNAIRFGSSSECSAFITFIEDFLDHELGQDLDVTAVEIMSELYD